MATKSKKVQSLVTSNADSSEVLAAAGVEVKLTKSELAEYVKEKALQTLRAKSADLSERILHINIKPVQFARKDLPPRVAAVFDAILGFKSDAATSIRFSHIGKHDWRIGQPDGWSSYFVGEADLVREADYIPASYGEYLKINKQIDEINEQIHQIEKKNFKAFMVENVLNGSDAGKAVIASLDEMVAKLIG
jgi:hypothetical protein